MRWITLLLLPVFLFACGSKFTPPDQDTGDGSTIAVDDTTYIQVRPAWGPETGYEFSNPHGLLVGNETLLYVADTGNNRVTMMDLAGNILGHSARIDSPVAVTQDAFLRLLVVSGRNYLFRLDLYAAGHDIASARIDTLYHAVDRPSWRFNGVAAFNVWSEDGIYYMVTCSGPSRNDNQILQFREDGTLRGPLPMTPGGTGLFSVIDPAGIVELRNGSVDFAYCQRGENYYKVQTITTGPYGWEPDLDPSEGSDLFELGKFSSPQAIAIDGDGFLFIADSDNNRVFKFAGNGREYESFGEEGSGEGQFLNPNGIDEFDGTVFVADSGNNRIVRFKLSTSIN